MLNLDATDCKLQILLGGTVTTNQVIYTAHYAERGVNPSTFDGGAQSGTSANTTAIDVTAAPAAGKRRAVSLLTVYQADTADVTLTVRKYDATNTRQIWQGTLEPGDTFTLCGAGVVVTDDSGQVKQTGSGSITVTADRAVQSDGSGNIEASTVTATELGYVSGVTSAIQTQIDGKAASSHAHAASDITSGTFADARIAESNVTQHEAALSLAASQITSGTLAHERGGLEADVSAGDGLVQIKGGSTTVIKSNWAATTAPAATDDSGSGYAVGSSWIDTTNDKAYVCLDATTTAAVWTETTQSGGGGAIGDLSDVTITSVASGEVLQYSGSAWINQTFAEAGIAPVASPTFTDTVTITNAGAGPDPTLSSNDAGQLLDLAGSLEVTGNLQLPTTTSSAGQLIINGTNHYHAYGSKNAFIGEGAGNFTLTGLNNTGIGYQALASLTSGKNNLGLGANALDALTEALRCVAIGQNAGGAITTGNDNTLVGYQSGKSITTGTCNTLLGLLTGGDLTTESENCLIGWRAGQQLTGAGNIFLGYQCGNTLTTKDDIFLVGVGTSSRFLYGEIANNNLALGSGAGFGTSATHTLLLYEGTAPSSSPTNAAQLYVNNASGAGTASLHIRNEEGHIFILRQQSTTGTTTGFTAGSGTGVNHDSTFTGGTGSTAYTVGDLVLAMKNIGAIPT